MSCANQNGGKGDEGNGSDQVPPLPVVVVKANRHWYTVT